MPDMTTFLGNSNETPLDLTGLSPEEIRGVSASRIGREQQLGQMVNLLAGQRGRETDIAAQEAATRLSEFKLEQAQKEAKPVTIKDAEGREFQVPTGSLMKTQQIIGDMKLAGQRGELADAQRKILETTIPMTFDDKLMDVTPAHAAILAEVETDRKAAEQKAAGIKFLQNKTPQDMMKPDNFGVLLEVNPGAATTILNRMTPAGDIGLTDPQYYRYSDLFMKYVEYIQKRTTNVNLATVESINRLGSKLGSTNMFLHKEGKLGKWGRGKAVIVPLPPGKTAKDIYADAADLGVDVSVILQGLYESYQE